MSEGDRTAVLVSDIDKARRTLGELRESLRGAIDEDLPKLGRTQRAAILVAGILEGYYPCAETAFLRISQFFENHLRPDLWHRELLERMTLDVEGVRPRVLSDVTYSDLSDLMQFRPFKRYYFGLAHDWERLDSVVLRLARVHPALDSELEEFEEFLREL